MPRRARQLAESGIYHVMVRGINRDAIFLEDADRQRFLDSLEQTRRASGCEVLAYCLMRNHVHLVLRIADEPIGLVMKRLGVRYVGWFNRKYGRVGHLFQDRFRSEPVEDDAYLVTLLRYVWENPVVAGMVKRPQDYAWSSRRYLGVDAPHLDDAELDRLLPQGWLTDAAMSRLAVPDLAVSRIGRPPTHTDDEVAGLLHGCGVESIQGFAALDVSIQRLVICELRTRSVSYAQIARATGLSDSAVRRMQISGAGPGTARAS